MAEQLKLVEQVLRGLGYGTAATHVAKEVEALEESKDIPHSDTRIAIELKKSLAHVPPFNPGISLNDIRNAVFTATEAAEDRGVTVAYIHRMIRQKVIPAIKIGNELLLDRADVSLWNRTRAPRTR